MTLAVIGKGSRCLFALRLAASQIGGVRLQRGPLVGRHGARCRKRRLNYACLYAVGLVLRPGIGEFCLRQNGLIAFINGIVGKGRPTHGKKTCEGCQYARQHCNLLQPWWTLGTPEWRLVGCIQNLSARNDRAIQYHSAGVPFLEPDGSRQAGQTDWKRYLRNLRDVGSTVKLSSVQANEGYCAMKVPYENKWQRETDSLRKIALDRGLVDSVKWGKPCFTYQGKNVANVIPLKEACALSFFKGALLTDPKRILQRIGKTQAGRWIKFTSLQEISALRSTLKRYLEEAIQVEQSGRKVPLKKVSDYAVPEELQARLDSAPELKAAFEALTPGRRKSYIFHVSSAKQAKTRAARAAKCVPMILSGRGFNEFTA
jgi:uncharacterized protein YdeI (YjbR/CyaY-like superfamily)